jgi:alanine dehydrogenase
MKIAVFRSSHKENERRLPIYPEHLFHISNKVKSYLYFEKGYGADFGFSDKELEPHCNTFLEREDLFTKCDMLLLPKATKQDLEKMHMNQILCGWAHCVQQQEITQIAINKKLTIIAWEAMHFWKKNQKLLHVFYKNNELAGYSAVIHVLNILGMDGHYGSPKKVSIISYGSVSKGAIYALQGRGFNNIHVYSRRPSNQIADQNPDVYYYNLYQKNNEYYFSSLTNKPRKFIEELSESDIIINGILQNPITPAIFVLNSQIKLLKRNSVIIDISCDERMGFEFATPTSFEKPIIKISPNIDYYSVDHTPSYLWNAATREISRALIPLLTQLIEDDFAFNNLPTFFNACEIKNGIIANKNIIKFQHRRTKYPYNYITNAI